jgi:hypothetical protein
MYSLASSLKNPRPVIEPVLRFLSIAMRSCSGVRVFEMVRTSLRSARNTDDPNAGGGDDRN